VVGMRSRRARVAWTTSTLLILPDRIVGCGAGRQSQSFSSSLLAQISAVA
jgi:hypothetical protein